MTKLPLAQLRKGKQLRANNSETSHLNLTPFAQTACWLISKDRMIAVLSYVDCILPLDCSVRSEADKRHPYTPTHSIVEPTIVILTQMLYCR